MKNIIPAIRFCLFGWALAAAAGCGKFEVAVTSTKPVDIGGIPDNYTTLPENTSLKIPIKFTASGDSGLASASYKVVNNRATPLLPVYSPSISLPVHNNSVDTTISVPVRRGTISVVITIYDKSGKLSARSIDIGAVSPSDAAVRSMTGVVMSTDPADNQNFFSFYEANPVCGAADALTRQSRIDFVLVNMGGAKMVAPHAYGASSDYYNATRAGLAGFGALGYSFFTAVKPYVSPNNFGAISKETDLAKFLDDSVISPKAANYNIMNADRRVSDAFTETAVDKGFIMGWGYHTAPTAATTVVLNESFGIIVVRSVTKKSNGHYIIRFDIKGPAADQRAAFPEASIIPYAPYPL
ncbi:MAG: hypothetical protein JST42_15160 [Bacteroidetes bacterium]|nr:hypothetical protein [Bacteroidota bacterium]